MEQAKSLKELLERGVVFPAMLPADNDHILNDEGKTTRANLIASGAKAISEFHSRSASEKASVLDLEALEDLVGYTVPLIDHDYGAATPAMWNSLYRSQGLAVRNIMVVGDPAKSGEILAALKADPKYLGGGAGSGFKETVIKSLDDVNPKDLKAVNIIVNKSGRLTGHNTDAEGAVRGLEEAYTLQGKTIEGSHVILLGAGGAGKEIARLLAKRKARKIGIVNRTYSKAVALAHELNTEHGEVAYGLPENLIRGALLNSQDHPHAIVHTTNKGSDGKFADYNAFAPVLGTPGVSADIARSTLRILRDVNPDVIINDIAVKQGRDTLSLRLARSEELNNLVDYRPMVIYQAVPAYKLIENAHPRAHMNQKLEEQTILETFRKAAA